MSGNIQVAAAVPVEARPIDEFTKYLANLVHMHRGRLVAYARKQGVDPEEALDCVQDAFQSFIQLPQAKSLIGAPDDSLKLLTVLVRHIVWNRRASLSRRARLLSVARYESVDDRVESSEELIASAQALAQMRGCILEMERLQRAVIELSLVDELPGEDVATELGISRGYVRVLLHRARSKLRSCKDAKHSD